MSITGIQYLFAKYTFQNDHDYSSAPPSTVMICPTINAVVHQEAFGGYSHAYPRKHLPRFKPIKDCSPRAPGARGPIHAGTHVRAGPPRRRQEAMDAM